MKIICDDCTVAVDGSLHDLYKGVERILEEIAYHNKMSVWEALKGVTVAVVDRERYLEIED